MPNNFAVTLTNSEQKQKGLKPKTQCIGFDRKS